MASTSFPDQQEQPEEVMYPPPVSASSGSIGPFFAVISVLAIITILSCVLGRFLSRQTEQHRLHVSYRDRCLWVRRKFCFCMSDELHPGVKPTIVKPQDLENPRLSGSS